MELSLPFNDGLVVITAESPFVPRYDALSADNSVLPIDESFLGDDSYRASSRHRIVVSQGASVISSRVLLANGGASGVHAHSAFIQADCCFVAVGPFVCALALPSLKILWYTKTDWATCFGVYNSRNYASIISHGELEIARLTYAGQILWSSGGRDIFTEGFELHEHHAEAVDFYGARFAFELETGQSRIVSA